MAMTRGGGYDLVVVGGGVGGLATAALAQRVGLRVALLEAHTRLGGCAGYFARGPFTFDAGATALMGLDPGEPLGDFLRCVGVDFRWEREAGYRIHLPDRVLDVVPDAPAFERTSAAAFPNRARGQRAFWRLQAAVGSALFRAAGRVPRLPVLSIGDLVYDLRALGAPGLLSGALALVTVRDVLRLLRLDGDVAFRSFIAMLLQDTAQAGPETVPFANAAACLHAYRLGLSRPVGGMTALAEGVGQRFAALGGDLRTATLVDRVECELRAGADGARGGSPSSPAVASGSRPARWRSTCRSTWPPACSAGRSTAGSAARSGGRGPPGGHSPATSPSTGARWTTPRPCSTTSCSPTTARPTRATTC
jgi:phytoene dehydrogenase-like protein